MLSLKLAVLALLLACYSLTASATTRTAADCSVAAIQAQVNASSDGDTVLVPPNLSATWTTVLTINIGITLNGQGCTVTFPAAAPFGYLVMTADTVANTFITGFTFNGAYSESAQAGQGPYTCKGPLQLYSPAGSKPYRFHHNTLNNAIGGIGGSNIVMACPGKSGPGLIDHNIITGALFGETIQVFGDDNDNDWTGDVIPGGSNFLFFEDNTICNGTWNGTACTITSGPTKGFIASYRGAKWVARHNHLNNANYDAHTTNPGSYLGVRWVEIYQNDETLEPSSLGCQSAYFEIRGGSGVSWGNTINNGLGTCGTGPGMDVGPTGSDLQTGTWPLARQLGRGIESPANVFGYSPFYSWGNATILGDRNCVGLMGLCSILTTYVQVGSSPTSSLCTSQSTGHPANVCDAVEFGPSTSTPPQLQRCQSAADLSAGCPFTYTYAPFTYPHPLVTGTPQAVVPACIPGAGTYPRQPLVSCSDASSGAVMCYTTNGTTPATNGTTGCTTGTKYAAPFFITATGTLRVIAGGTGFTDSTIFSSAFTVTGDQYGGRLDINCATTTAYFHLEKIGQRWWFCTPQGHGFISMNVANILTNGSPTLDCANVDTFPIYTAKYGDATFNWAWQQLNRATHWGFNTNGQDSGGNTLPGATCPTCLWPNHKQPLPIPYVTEAKPAQNASINVNSYIAEPIKDVIEATSARYTSGRQGALYDVFDPKLNQWWNAALATNTALKTNDPYLIGLLTDDSDYFWGSGAGPDYITGHTNANIAWTTLISSPVQTFANHTSFGNHTVIYQNTQNYSKTQALNPTTCSIAAPCSLRDYLKNKYTTIAALNTAWGSSYTTFDSSATQVTGEAFATGDGVTTSFTHTLAHAPDPFSVLFLIAGTAQLGDCPWYYATASGNCINTTANLGTLGSPNANFITQSTSTINYTTGAVTINFVNAPANGAAITVNYQWGGWGQGGTGLMDEDGSHTAWVGTNPACLEGPDPNYPTYFSCIGGGGNNNPVPNANANLGADLDAWVSQMAAEYFKTMHDDLRAVSNIPYWGLDLIGSWSAPAYSKFLQGTAPYVDLIMTDMHWFLPLPSPNVFQNQFQYNTQYMGDLPIINYGNGGEAQSDSGYSCKPGDINTVASQPVRGQNYKNSVNYLLTTPSFNGDFPVVGFDHWAWQDFQNLNQGLVDVHDNAYDGIEATTASVPCANYYTSLTNCGGEPAGFNAPYGDYVDPVTQGNQIWLTVTNGSGSPTVAFNPTSLGFGNLVLYVTVGPLQGTVTNTGTVNVTIASVTATGVFALVAPTVAPDCRTVGVLTPSASCNFAVTATPAVAGPASGSIIFVDTAAGSPQSFPLSVTGIQVAPAPAVSFGGH